MYLSINLSLCPSVYLLAYLYIYLFIRDPTEDKQFIYLHECLFIYSNVYLFSCMHIYLFINFNLIFMY